jgi:three-Cys-motif partner protein
MRANNFDEVHYIDPFSGSGMIELLGKYRFPGSPLLPLIRSNTIQFDRCYFSDINGGYVDALRNRLTRISSALPNVTVVRSNFSKTIDILFTGEKPERWKKAGYLVFLDPYGFGVDWAHMEKVLKSGPVDVIFTFMTWAIVWNKNNKMADRSLEKYFGDKGWKGLGGQDDFVDYYCKKIEQFGYSNKYRTFTIDVIQEGGMRYDLILATQSSGGANVLRALRNRVKAVSTQLLESAFSVAVGEQKDLDSFLK